MDTFLPGVPPTGRPVELPVVIVVGFRDGKVAHETIYFGEPWQPPAWRAQWVELVERATLPLGREVADTP